MDQHWVFFLVSISAILLFQSKLGKTTITAGAQASANTTDRHVTVWNKHLQLSHTSWRLFVFQILLTSCVSLQQSAAERFIPLTVPIFQAAVFYKNLWSVTGDCRFSHQRVHGGGGRKRDSALFNKQLHVIQSDWNYLIIMLNNNKSVVLFNMYSLFPLSKHIPLCHVHICG